MAIFNYTILGSGPENSSSTGVGLSTAIGYVEREPPVNINDKFIMPSWAQSVNGPDPWVGMSLSFSDGSGSFVRFRAYEPQIVSTNDSELITVPTGTQIGDYVYVCLIGYGTYVADLYVQNFTSTEPTWEIKFPFQQWLGGSDYMYVTIARFIYDGSSPTVSATNLIPSNGWAFSSLSFYADNGIIYDGGYDYQFDPTQTFEAYPGAAGIYFVASADNNRLIPVATSSKSIYIPGEISGTIDSSFGLSIEGTTPPAPPSTSATLELGHRVIAEFGNNSQNDNQIITASSAKIATRGFHLFETTTDSYQNPPVGTVTKPSTDPVDFSFTETFEPIGWDTNWAHLNNNGSDVSGVTDGGSGQMGQISLGPTATYQAATEYNVLLPSNFDAVVPFWPLNEAGGYSALPTDRDKTIVLSFRSTQEHVTQTLANCYALYVNLSKKTLSIYKVNETGAHTLLKTATSQYMIATASAWPHVIALQCNGYTIRAMVGTSVEGGFTWPSDWEVSVVDTTYAGNSSGNYMKVAYFDGTPSSTGGGGTGGGTGGNGGGPGGGTGTADIRQMFLDRYAHPAITVKVANDAEVAAAITQLASTGGIIEMATGTYGPVSFVNVNPSQYILLMPASGATVHIDAAGQADAEGLERGILIKNSSYIGAYGLEISSVNASGHPYADCVGVANAHHIAIWNCDIHDGASGVGGVECNHYDICYNYVHDTSGWLDTFASGISLYKLVNIGGGVDADGYDNRIIGNISYNNENDPSYGGAITDGNGIIIDIANGDYATNLVGYTGRVLVMNNITINNGGRGIHSLFSRNCDIMFNTSVGNCNSTAINGQAEIDTIGSENCVVRGNISFPNAGNKWFDIYEVATTPVDNVILAEPSSYDASNNFDRSAQGSNYFGTPTIGTWTSFRPITSDEVVVDSALYSRIGGWPDALRNYRTDTTWSAGAIEVFANSSTSPDEPVAPFFYPEDYGALGNGVADDTAALQACMDAVLANGSGSMILNSSKTYCHSDVLFCDGIPMYGGGSRSGNDITGGAILWGTNDTTSNVWLRDGASAFGIIFRNDATTRGANYEHNKVTMRGNGITVKNCAVHGSYAAGFMGSAATNSTVENLIVMNTNSDSIHNTDACDNITYTDCYVENSGDDCFAIVGYGGQGPNTNITWIRPVCRGGNARGVAMVGADNCVAQDVDLQDTAYAGIYISNETISYDTEPTTNCSVTGGKVTSCANGNNGHPSILFFQDTGGTVNNCSITGVDIYNQAGDGAYFIEGRGGPTSCSATNVTVFSTPRTALTAGGITATNVVYG